MKKNKILFFPELGGKPYEHKDLSQYMTVADVDWNTGKYSPSINKFDTVISFSLGALFPLEYAQKKKIKRIILCSPSAFEHTGKLKTDELIFLVGDKEKWLKKETERVFKNYKGKKKFIVVKGDHSLTGEYKKNLLSLI